MDRWKNTVAVVTGASAGIGAAISKKLIENGLKVVGIARRKERLLELQEQFQNGPGKFYSIPGDVSKEEDILNAFRWIKVHLGPVHILINNAGIMRNTSLIDGNSAFWKEVFDINVLGVSIATREAIRMMRTHNIDGHIIHINSTAGHKVLALPDFNVYSASKFALTALAETLKQELNSIKSKIKVTSISPGHVATEIFKATAVGSGKKAIDEEFQKLLDKSPSIEASDVADCVIYVLSTSPHVQVHEVIIKPVGEVF